MEYTTRQLRRTIGIAAGVMVVAAAGYCQSGSLRPEFDAASVKMLDPEDERQFPMPSRMLGGPGTGSPGRITYTRVSLRDLVKRAWGLPSYRIFGPSWIGIGAFYTVSATMPPETTEQSFKLMLQDLIVRRFQMTFHYEDRIASGYELVVAPGGPKLKLSADPDAPDPTTGIPTGPDKDGFARLPPGHGAGVVMANGTRAKFQNYTMVEFAEDAPYLRSFVGLATGRDLGIGEIKNKTGLTGKYDFTLAFDTRRAPAIVIPAGRIRTDATDGVAVAAPSGLPDLFSALEKQLGLRLVPVKDIPAKVLVIDKVEKAPIED